jgi:phosphoacetylglucosamine mutase
MPLVFLGRDTRESSPLMSEQIIEGLEILGVRYKDYGQISTPQLHWMVNINNDRTDENHATPEDYVEYFAGAFSKFCELSKD